MIAMTTNPPPDDTMQLVATRLRVARARKYKTAADAARALGLNPITVRAHETGQNGIPMSTALLYCRAYGISPVWLAHGTELPDYQVDEQKGVCIPLSGVVENGAWRSQAAEVFVSSEEAEVWIPESRTTPLLAYRIRGHLYSPDFPDGSIILAQEADGKNAGPRLRVWDYVLMQRTRDDLTSLCIRQIGFEGNVVRFMDVWQAEEGVSLEAGALPPSWEILGVITNVYQTVRRASGGTAIDKLG